jgi:chemotaxis response regulator CheB
MADPKREADSLEGYQIQGTYRPREDFVVQGARAIRNFIKEEQRIAAESRAKQDEQRENGQITEFKTLDAAVIHYSRQGYELVHKDEHSAQMVQRKRFRGFQVIGVGVLTGGLSVLPHALQQAGKRDKVIMLMVDTEGRVRQS